MELVGTIINIGDVISGESTRGEWKKRELIIETDEIYSKNVCLQLWGDEVDNDLLKNGAKLRFLISIQSREYKAKWYTDVRAYSIHEIKNEAIDEPSLDDIFGPSDDESPF